MAAHGVNQLLAASDLGQQLRSLPAVLLRPLLKVNVVEEARCGPETGVLTVAQLVRVPPHDALHRQGVLNVEGLGIVLAQQRHGRRPVGTVFHKNLSFIVNFHRFPV